MIFTMLEAADKLNPAFFCLHPAIKTKAQAEAIRNIFLFNSIKK